MRVPVKALFLCGLVVLLGGEGHAQHQRGGVRREALFLQAEYQALNYDFLSFGLGFQPKRSKGFTMSRRHPHLAFQGWTLNYTRHFGTEDWGASLQAVSYSATPNGPFGIGVEANYKSIAGADHFGLKPMIGLSLYVFSVMYGYNFDLYEVKEQRINQGELLFGIRFPIVGRGS